MPQTRRKPKVSREIGGINSRSRGFGLDSFVDFFRKARVPERHELGRLWRFNVAPLDALIESSSDAQGRKTKRVDPSQWVRLHAMLAYFEIEFFYV